MNAELCGPDALEFSKVQERTPGTAESLDPVVSLHEKRPVLLVQLQ